MFIQQKRLGLVFVVNIVDDKNLLLHYFDKEIETLTLQSPLLLIIELNPNDRKGFKIKIGNILKKVSKEKSFNCIIGSTEFVTKILKTKEIEEFIKKGK